MTKSTDHPTGGPSPAPDTAAGQTCIYCGAIYLGARCNCTIGLNPTGRPRRSSAGTRRRKAAQNGGQR